MVETVEMQEIRGLDIDKTVKGFALAEYIFKSDCQQSTMSGDSVRWYAETNSDLSATAPQTINISPLSIFPTLEVSWTRNTSYPKKYGVEGFISLEDIKSADIDVVARTLLRLTRALVKKVDTDIWNVMTESQSPSNIQTFSVMTNGGACWDADSGQDIIKDLSHAKKLIYDYDYNPEGASLYVSGKDYESIVTWLISTKGSSIPQYASDKITTGTVMQLLGLNIKVSNNVTISGAAVVIPQRACTWKSYSDITSRAIVEEGLGTKIRVWEHGIALLTDPKAVVYMTATQK